MDRAAVEAALAAGDRGAFAAAHARYAPGIRQFFLRRTGGRIELAEELEQQTWTHLWSAVRMRRYDPTRARVSTFVYAIAHNVWLQHCRASGRRVPDWLAGEFAPDSTGVAEHAEILDALRDCLARRDGPEALTQEERDVILEVAAGASERDLARTRLVAASTVHARKTSALQKLRKCLARKGFSEESIERSSLELE